MPSKSHHVFFTSISQRCSEQFAEEKSYPGGGETSHLIAYLLVFYVHDLISILKYIYGLLLLSYFIDEKIEV